MNPAPDMHRVGTWSTTPDLVDGAALAGQTVRMVTRDRPGGERLCAREPAEQLRRVLPPTVSTSGQAINRWIRESNGFDAVIDFDAALRGPAHPTRLLPHWDSGDHLHPNDAGYPHPGD